MQLDSMSSPLQFLQQQLKQPHGDGGLDCGSCSNQGDLIVGFCWTTVIRDD